MTSRKFILIFLVASILTCFSAFGQYAYRIRPVPSLPAVCNPLNGDVVQLTAGAGVSPGIYSCTGTNTWKPAGMMGNQYVISQGTLTASAPFISQTATWNNAGVTFENITTNVTDTASAIGSFLMDLQVGGVSQFTIGKSGSTISRGSSTIGSTGGYFISTRSVITSGADGIFTMTNNALTDFTRLTLGLPSVAFPAVSVSPAVGGQTQGIIITKGDGTNAVFADLGAASNGSMIYCSNCTVANPCAGGGTGAIAKRLNGAWVCN